MDFSGARAGIADRNLRSCRGATWDDVGRRGGLLIRPLMNMSRNERDRRIRYARDARAESSDGGGEDEKDARTAPSIKMDGRAERNLSNTSATPAPTGSRVTPRKSQKRPVAEWKCRRSHPGPQESTRG